MITCISILEHIKDHKAAVTGMFKLLETGGHIVLTFPYNENHYLKNIYDHPFAGYGKEAPYICQNFSRDEINCWIKENNTEIVLQKYYQIFSGDYWTFWQRIYPPREVSINDKHHLLCMLIQKKPD